MRPLDADHAHTRVLRLIVIGALLGAWLSWFFLAQIELYELSNSARLVGVSQVVAEFAPVALGRIRPGQQAQLHLDGFSRTQYGALSATVTRIAYDASSGQARVRLKIDPSPTSSIPLQDGLTGSIEVTVERVSPAILTLRAIGQPLVASGNSSPAQGSSGASK